MKTKSLLELRAKFGTIGIAPGKAFESDKLSEVVKRSGESK